MGISRDKQHKRRLTGGKRPYYRKKRKFLMGRQPTMTKIGNKVVRSVRVRGGNLKRRALRLDTGNFAWGSEAIARPTRLLGVVYNASNNELVRTNTLVKGAVIQVDATPFKTWYHQHYNVELGKRKGGEEQEETKRSERALARIAERQRTHKLDKAVEEQFVSGRLYARVSSRPGQCGRCDGYILEGKELEFYSRQMAHKKKKTK